MIRQKNYSLQFFVLNEHVYLCSSIDLQPTLLSSLVIHNVLSVPNANPGLQPSGLQKSEKNRLFFIDFRGFCILVRSRAKKRPR